MKFIQFQATPSNGINRESGYYFGKENPLPQDHSRFQHPLDQPYITKLQDWQIIPPNGGVGWFTDGANKMSFKLELVYD